MGKGRPRGTLLTHTGVPSSNIPVRKQVENPENSYVGQVRIFSFENPSQELSI